MRKIRAKFTKMGRRKYATMWVCPDCDCKVTYRGEGNMRCPNCKAWMAAE